MMRVVVMGAGAVGCYFGGLLAHAGQDVAFVGRPIHVDAINTRGLLIEAPAFSGTVKATATTDASSLGPADLVLVCTKSADTEQAGASLAGALGETTTIVSLQNGVDNAERLAATIKRPVVAAVVYVGAEMVGAGHVKHHGRGDLIIGSSPSSEAIAKVLREAKIPTQISANIASVLWTKLVANCAWNAMSAISALPYGTILAVSGARELVTSLVRECEAVARAQGVDLPDNMLEQVLDIAAKMPGQMSSTAQDLMRGKLTEVDYLNGYIMRKGQETSVPTPLNSAMQVMVKLLEHRRGLEAVAQ